MFPAKLVHLLSRYPFSSLSMIWTRMPVYYTLYSLIAVSSSSRNYITSGKDFSVTVLYTRHIHIGNSLFLTSEKLNLLVRAVYTENRLLCESVAAKDWKPAGIKYVWDFQPLGGCICPDTLKLKTSFSQKVGPAWSRSSCFKEYVFLAQCRNPDLHDLLLYWL